MSKPWEDHDGADTGKHGASARDQLLRLVRMHAACLHALQLDSTRTVTDEEIMGALAREFDSLEIHMKDRFVPVDTIAEIQQLFRQDRAEQAAMSHVRRDVIWKTFMRIPLCASAVLAVTALGLFLSTLRYSRAVCALHDFTNGTCNHENSCHLQVVVQVGNEATLLPDWQLPIEAWDESGLVWYNERGPFKCCNDAGQYVRGDANLSGAGSSCCDFYDAQWQVFCDNFGAEERRPPVPECPTSPWSCGAIIETVARERKVKELWLWQEPPSLEVFGASLICLAVSGLVRLFPRFTDFIVRGIEVFVYSVFPRLVRTVRRLRRRCRRLLQHIKASLRRPRPGEESPEGQPEEPASEGQGLSGLSSDESTRRKKRRIKVKASPAHRPHNVVHVRQKELVQSEMPGVTEHKSFERAGPIAVAAVLGGGKQKASNPQKHETPTPTRIVVKARAAAAPRDDQDQPMETTLLPSAVPALPAGHAEEPPAQNVLRPIISPPGHKGQDRHGPSAQARGGRARPQARGQQAPRAVRGAHGAAPRLVQRAAQNAMQRSQGQVEWMQTAAQLRELSRNQEHGTQPLLPETAGDLTAERSMHQVALAAPAHRGANGARHVNPGVQRPPRATQL
ncbi:ANKHD1 [Symbiodinium necroappetens]|uniref:ANKHD1 protein n=1 Tax=Symbiodinium necroappetens TaxID=1628268 RepID=A0A812QLP7_9DINO|nr:ANKHD1 [Symbiodinium necroappetens]